MNELDTGAIYCNECNHHILDRDVLLHDEYHENITKLVVKFRDLGFSAADIMNYDKVRDNCSVVIHTSTSLGELITAFRKLVAIYWVEIVSKCNFEEVISYETYAKNFVFLAYREQASGTSEVVQNVLLAVRTYVGVPTVKEQFSSIDELNSEVWNNIKNTENKFYVFQT